MWWELFGFLGRPPEPMGEQRTDIHWRVELSDEQHRGLLLWARSTGRSYSNLSAGWLEQLEAAEERPGGLPPLVDWSALEKREAQGYSMPDQIYDNFPPKKDKP